MKNCIILVALMIALASGRCLGQERVYLDVSDIPAMQDLSAGHYDLHITEGGEITVTPFRLVEIGKTPTDQPPQESLVARVDRVADKIRDPSTRKSLAVSYGALVVISDRFSSTEEIGRAAKQAADRAIGNSESWDPFRSLLAEEFAKSARLGNLQSVDDYVALLRQVIEGLSSNSNAAGQQFEIGDIISILQDVLPILTGEEDLTFAAIIEIALKVVELFLSFDVQVSGVEFLRMEK